MKSIANKTLYSLGGAFKTIGKEIGHLYNILSYIIIRATGTSITLNNTIPGRMNIELGTSELEQETTTGKNLINTDGSGGYNGITVTNNGDGTFTVTGTSTGAVGVAITTSRPVLTANQIYTQVVETISGTKAGQIVPSFKNSGGTITYNYFTDSESKTPTEEMTCNTYNYYLSTTGTQVNWTFRVMLCKGTDTTYEPYTGGIPAPNPSFPMPIHTISGSNKIVICGINKFNKLTSTANKYLSSSDGSLLNSSTSSTSDFINIDKNSQYTISGYGTSNYYKVVAYYDSSKTFISANSTTDSNNTYSITTPNNAKYLRFHYTTANENQVMLNEGSTALPYEPYVSQEANINLGDIEYCEIGDYKDEFVRSSGKNLFNLSNDNLSASWDGGDVGKVSIVDTINSTIQTTAIFTTWRAKSINVDNLKPNTKYNLSFVVVSSTSSPQQVVVQIRSYNGITATKIGDDYTYGIGKNTIQFTTPSDIQNLGLSFSSKNAGTSVITEIMLSIENEDYEPYGTDKWYLKKNIGKVVFDGTENWLRESYAGQYYYRLATTITNQTNGLSNYYTVIPYSSSLLQYTNSLRINNSIIDIVNDKSDVSLADFKNWLSTHNTEVYYILSTPTYTQITETLAEQLENIYQYLMSYKGQTSISQINNDLPFELIVKAFGKE